MKLRSEVSDNPSALMRENARKVGEAALKSSNKPSFLDDDVLLFWLFLELIGVAIILAIPIGALGGGSPVDRLQ